MSDHGPVLPQRAALRAYSYIIVYVQSLQQTAETELMEHAQQQCIVTLLAAPPFIIIKSNYIYLLTYTYELLRCPYYEYFDYALFTYHGTTDNSWSRKPLQSRGL